MSFARIIVVLMTSGVGLWGVNVYIPTTPAVKAVITAVLAFLLCLWLLQTFGVIASIRNPRAM